MRVTPKINEAAEEISLENAAVYQSVQTKKNEDSDNLDCNVDQQSSS